MLLIVPLLGALIGWLTNKIAIILIFRPYKPITIPMLNYTIQGLLPKRRNQIAADIGKLVQEDLLPFDDLIDKLKKPELQKKVIEGLAIAVYQHLIERLPVSLPVSLKALVFQQVQEVVRREAPSFFEKLLDSVSADVKNQVSLQELVQEKIEGFEIKDLENMLVRIVNRELRHIELLGGILGFIIGLIQVIFVILFYD